MSQIWPLPVFINNILFTYIFSTMAAFELQEQHQVATSETIQPAKLKVCTVSCYRKCSLNPMVYKIMQENLHSLLELIILNT